MTRLSRCSLESGRSSVSSIRRVLDVVGRLPRPAKEEPAAVAPRELGERLVVLSPHLDDAVFSLGATISQAARGGVRVTVLTVFGGDPGSAQPAGPWDRVAGFSTAGEAAAERRREDERACRLVSATPAWERFADEQYRDGADDDAVAEAVAAALANADALLLPGFPLSHADHSRLARIVLEHRIFAGPMLLYVEQPYARWTGAVEVPPVLEDLLPAGLTWRGTRIGLSDVARKLRACRAYRSQLACIPHRIVWPMSRFELTSRQVLAPIDRTA